MTPTIHILAPFHTLLTPDYDFCAFTAKTRRFSSMMKGKARLIEYANEGSQSEADEKIVMLNREEHAKEYPWKEREFLKGDVGSDGWKIFAKRLALALKLRAKRGDYILHFYGKAYKHLAAEMKNICHVEPGVGYNDEPFEAFRIYESEAWKHHQWGKFGLEPVINGNNRDYTWVIPISYDVNEWPATEIVRTKRPYFLFLGRLNWDKGTNVMAHAAREWFDNNPDDQHLFVFAGQGEFEYIRKECGRWADRARFVGPVKGDLRRDLVANAEAMLMPTRYVEPFGSSGAEALLCGTPLLASDWGAFTETVQHDKNGYRCKQLADWLFALKHAKSLNRASIAENARDLYDMRKNASKYLSVFEQLHTMTFGKGWYAKGNDLPAL